MERYWVVGGEYESTDFRRIAGGKVEERHGPLDSLEAACAKWASLAMATVDNAHIRYRIEKEDARTVLFKARVPKDGSRTLRYRVRYSW